MAVLPGRRYPELINDDEKLLENSFVVPDAALADVSAAVRAPAVNGRAQTISEFAGWVKPTDSIQRPEKRSRNRERPRHRGTSLRVCSGRATGGVSPRLLSAVVH